MGTRTYALNVPPGDLARSCGLVKQHLFGKETPLACVIIDTETTGLSAAKDWLYELAALFVVIDNGQHVVQHSFHSYINWTDSGLVSFDDFTARVDETNLAMAQKDSSIRRPNALEIAALGKHPFQVFQDFSEAVKGFFSANPQCRRVFSGHNAFQFDANFLHQSCGKAGLISPIGGDILDTGLIVKAAQTTEPEYHPVNYKYPVDWMLKVRNARLPVKWSLANFCDPLFGLRSRLPDYVHSFRHTSLTDVWMTKVLLELFDNYTESLP